MDRFTIKIDASLKSRLQQLCRLCGIANPNRIKILEEQEWLADDEPILSKKILDCVGVQVTKKDKLPQEICQLCFDKISDFFEYRKMCEVTQIQTRKLLGLPEPKNSLKMSIKKEIADNGEEIFGIVGGETSHVDKRRAVRPKKSKVPKREIPSPSTIVISDEEEYKPKATKRMAVKKEIASPSGKLLARKTLNEREKKSEIIAKKNERKRKIDEKIAAAAIAKRIKKEKMLTCDICYAEFRTAKDLLGHQSQTHTVNIVEFGCGSCIESFETENEYVKHHSIHRRKSYICIICKQTFVDLDDFEDHTKECVHSDIFWFVDDVKCDKCGETFITKNLYDWHSCFIGDRKPCPTCGKIFLRQPILFRHIFQCKSIATSSKQILDPSQIMVKIPSPKKKNTRIRQINIKKEPEDIIEETESNNDLMNTSIPINSVNLAQFSNLRIKLEPLDVEQFPSVPKPVVAQNKVTARKSTARQISAPPIVIKTEIIDPGYRHDTTLFDPEIARNIKNEKVTTITGDSLAPSQVYKMPKKLAHRILQEKLARKNSSDAASDDIFVENSTQNGGMNETDEIDETNAITYDMAIRIKQERRTPSPAPMQCDEQMEGATEDMMENADELSDPPLTLAICNVVSLTDPSVAAIPELAPIVADATEDIIRNEEINDDVTSAMDEDDKNDSHIKDLEKNVSNAQCPEANEKDGQIDSQEDQVQSEIIADETKENFISTVENVEKVENVVEMSAAEEKVSEDTENIPEMATVGEKEYQEPNENATENILDMPDLTSMEKEDEKETEMIDEACMNKNDTEKNGAEQPIAEGNDEMENVSEVSFGSLELSQEKDTNKIQEETKSAEISENEFANESQVQHESPPVEENDKTDENSQNIDEQFENNMKTSIESEEMEKTQPAEVENVMCASTQQEELKETEESDAELDDIQSQGTPLSEEIEKAQPQEVENEMRASSQHEEMKEMKEMEEIDAELDDILSQGSPLSEEIEKELLHDVNGENDENTNVTGEPESDQQRAGNATETVDKSKSQVENCPPEAPQ